MVPKPSHPKDTCPPVFLELGQMLGEENWTWLRRKGEQDKQSTDHEGKNSLWFASPRDLQILVVGLWPAGGGLHRAIALFTTEHFPLVWAASLQSVTRESCIHNRTHKPTLTSAGATSNPSPGCTGVLRLPKQPRPNREGRLGPAPDSQTTLSRKDGGLLITQGSPAFVNIRYISRCIPPKEACIHNTKHTTAVAVN